jgi:sigma-B regulation protein RsbU (phosphoserine phosphatase)
MLRYLNRQLASMYTSAGTFVTAFYAVLDTLGADAEYARAGHNPPRLVRGGGGGVAPLDGVGSLPLGIDPEQGVQGSDSAAERG